MLRALKKLLNSAPPRPAATIYTRPGCHLCEEADQLLRKHGFEPRHVDIDQDPELIAKYTECVPVVVIDGRECFRGRVNEVLLRRLIRASERQASSS